MVLHISHATYFRKTSGPALIAMLHLLISNGRRHLEILRFLGRHPMSVGFDGMAWVSLEDHYVSTIYHQQPHMYHKEGETYWRDVLFMGEDLHTFCST